VKIQDHVGNQGIGLVKLGNMKILLTESQVINLIKQDISEEITGGSIIVYHRTKLTEDNVKLLNNGFVPGNGTLYGRGLYSTYELNDQLTPKMEEYGSIVVKLSIMDTSKILVLDKSEQVKLFGKNISLIDQMKKILKGSFTSFYNSNKKELERVEKDINNEMNDYTSIGVEGLTNIPKVPLIFDGIVFTSYADGRVLVLFDTSLGNPLQYVNTKTTKKGDKLNWISLKSKDSHRIGKDERGISKLANYLLKNPIVLDFPLLKYEQKKEIVFTKIKYNIFMILEEYQFYISEFSPSPEELETYNIKMISGEPSTIKYIKNPSEQLQISAVRNNGHLIEFIKNPSEEVQLASVKNNGYSIEYIENPSEEVQLSAVLRSPYSIEHIIEKGIIPSEQVQLAAVKENLNAFNIIKNKGIVPSEQLQMLVKIKSKNFNY
jgi:hypothetical protein